MTVILKRNTVFQNVFRLDISSEAYYVTCFQYSKCRTKITKQILYGFGENLFASFSIFILRNFKKY